MKEIGPIEVGEIKNIKFDFSAEAESATTLSLPSVSCTLLEGVDPSYALVLVGLPVVEGKYVVQKVQPGVVGCAYKLRAFATDSSGLRHGASVRLKVVNG